MQLGTGRFTNLPMPADPAVLVRSGVKHFAAHVAYCECLLNPVDRSPLALPDMKPKLVGD